MLQNRISGSKSVASKYHTPYEFDSAPSMSEHRLTFQSRSSKAMHGGLHYNFSNANNEDNFNNDFIGDGDNFPD
jgi:hypothetical protein